MWANYNPQGAMGGLFAPAYIRGPGGSTFQPSEDALAAYNAQQHPLTSALVDELRIPNKPPVGGSGGTIGVNWPYSMGVPAVQRYGDPRGTVDPEALRVLAQGGHYDVQARRDAIAQQVQANAAAAAAPPVAAPADPINIEGFNSYPEYATNPDGTIKYGPDGQPVIKGYSYKRSPGQDYNNVGA
jgi:hypothetical protein